ncbi:MAG TPA: ATP-binding cassette domain-containing protein [bacterium]|nr:ATP-binding cassette domain-containing protein [bacterium]HOL48482.1 ATP-binding cassette domain-containing protein [bacterium]HPQ17712.1 ATP-binding cassette domain-containing protein [bacterium]
MKKIITVEKLNFRYKEKQILDNINFEILENEILVILGQSGSGKTTLLKNLLGLVKPETGKIVINDFVLTDCDDREELRYYYKNIGVLFQNATLLNSLTIYENLALPLIEKTNLAREIIEVIIKMKLSWVGLNDVNELYPYELSGGMKKRAALARALIMDPKILYFDEPHSGLDPITTYEINTLLLELKKFLKITFIVITHDISSAFLLADKLLILNAGKVEFFGTKSEFNKVHQKNEFLKKFVDFKRIFDFVDYEANH